MKILYLANLSPNKLGSIEEHALFLCRELIRRGHDCYLGFISPPEPEIRCQFEKAGATLLSVYCGNTPLVGSSASFRPREMLALYRLIVKHRIDLVHVNFMALTNPLLLGVYLTRAKVIFTEHASGLPLRRGPIKKIVSRCTHAAVSRRVSKYVGVSDYVRRRLLLTNHVSPDKALTLYNGVNLERFYPMDQKEARRSLGLPIDQPIICSVAMLIPEKGIQHLLEAIALLVKDLRSPEILALVAGEGYYRTKLEQLASNLGIGGHVRFLGRRSDVQTIIAAADAVVVPSIWDEAFGLIIAEAMASGRPVVASNVGGIPELIADGVTGFLVSRGNNKELSDFIYKLISNSDDRTRLSGAALQHAQHHFDLSRQVQCLIAIYEKVLLGRESTSF